MEASDPRRKFPRIFLVGIHDLKELIGAKVEWENSQRTDVVDMSYTGIAVVRPSGIEFEKNKVMQIKLLISGFEPQALQAKLIRENEKIFGLQFLGLTKANIDVMDQFLSDKILGRNLRPVSPRFFNSKHQFNQWLHGPNHTNLYIWQQGQEITKFVLEFGGQALVFENKTFALEKVENAADEDEYIVFPLSKPRTESKDIQDFIKRSLKVLSQVEQPPACLWSLIDLLQAEVDK